MTVFALGLTPLHDAGMVWTVGALAENVTGEPQVLATHEFATLEWFAADELPGPLFGPTRFVLDALAGVANAPSVAVYTLGAWEAAR